MTKPLIDELKALELTKQAEFVEWLKANCIYNELDTAQTMRKAQMVWEASNTRQQTERNKVIDEIDEELKVIQQALLEVRHAQSSGAEWYTRGHNGLFMQVRLWLDKADKAFKAINALKDKKGGSK